MPRCLVIGGTRAIGPPVVTRLVERGWDVAVLHRGVHRAMLPAGVREMLDPEAGMPVLTFPTEAIAFAPDVVLHMIAMGARDGAAIVNAFDGCAGRLVAVSSGDVYRAYGRLIGTEPGPVEPMPLREDAPPRETLYPYRKPNTAPDALEHWYDKIEMERAVCTRASLPATILRLPKVYGSDDNADLATVYAFVAQPHWRWTHGHVDNVAAAIALAVSDPRATGEVFNVGEAITPSMGERLALLPPRAAPPAPPMNFAQDIVYDTAKIRALLGYCDEIDEAEAMSALAAT
jgi:nucleoside-diphosphate-sugar epimerase